MVNSMNPIIKRLQKEFSQNPDFKIKEIKCHALKTIYVVFIETIASSDKVNDYILKPLINYPHKVQITANNLNNFLAGPNQSTVQKPDEAEFYLTNGFTLIILNTKILAVETKADLTRSIAPTEVQSAINGPKEGFTENYQTNIGLIKRRIKTADLKIINRYLGRDTNTTVGLLYLKHIADSKLVAEALNRIAKIDIDGIVDSSSLAFLIEEENKTVFPTVKYSERPDEVVTELLKGKVALVIDTSPFVLIIPAFFIDFINPVSDNYTKSINITFLKVLRLLTFFIGIITPAFFNALLCYNPESIPMSLLINFVIQREGVPFPLIVETIIMLLICDILKESDMRFPSSYGSSISILGAIILGQASVEAGLVSPIIIIVIAITFIASLAFSDIEISNAIRYFMYIFLLASAFFGLYGLFLSFIFLLINISSVDSFNKPYLTPLAPFDKTYLQNSVFKKPLKKDTKRSKVLSKNRIKQGENS